MHMHASLLFAKAHTWPHTLPPRSLVAGHDGQEGALVLLLVLHPTPTLLAALLNKEAAACPPPTPQSPIPLPCLPCSLSTHWWPGITGRKGLLYCSLYVSARAPMVRPWKQDVKDTIS